jgi:hypothetical protein
VGQAALADGDGALARDRDGRLLGGAAWAQWRGWREGHVAIGGLALTLAGSARS